MFVCCLTRDLRKLGGEKALRGRLPETDIKEMSQLNQETLKYWNQFYPEPTTMEETENLYIWCNQIIHHYKVIFQPTKAKRLNEENVSLVKDILNTNNKVDIDLIATAKNIPKAEIPMTKGSKKKIEKLMSLPTNNSFKQKLAENPDKFLLRTKNGA